MTETAPTTEGGLAAERPVLSNRERMLIERQAMPEQLADVRITNFDEVNLGFTELLAIAEAERCINCPNAGELCEAGCPVKVNIPRSSTSSSPATSGGQPITIGRQRPALRDRPGLPPGDAVRGRCVRGKKGGQSPSAPSSATSPTGRCATATSSPRATRTTRKRIAIVGSGPAGLTAAGELAKMGHAVTIFEAFHAPGGVLIYGIRNSGCPRQWYARSTVCRWACRSRAMRWWADVHPAELRSI